MRRILFLIIFVVILLSSCAQHQQTIPIHQKSNFEPTFQENEQNIPDNSLNSQLLNLTDQIIANLSQESKSKIAIIEFSDLNGNVTEFGMYLSEELITRLYLTHKFEVIERQLLNQVIAEQKLGMSGLIDDESAIAIGKLLGVDAIVTGSVTDLGVSLKVNARLISTETGAVFAVAAAEFSKDEKVTTLLSRMKETEKTYSQNTETEMLLEKQPPDDNKIFFKEDFSEIEEGDIPDNWLGAEKLMVENDGRKKYLTFFEKAEFYNTNIQNINFPENWKLEFAADLGYWNAIEGNIGNLYYWILPWNSSVQLDNTKQEVGRYKGSTTFAIMKKGNKITLSLNGSQVILTRKPDFQKPNSIQFGIRWGNRDRFKIYHIIGTELSDNDN